MLILDFPNHGVPRGEYQVFEIANVLSGTTEITVGTFNKNIAERLTELDIESKKVESDVLDTESVNSE